VAVVTSPTRHSGGRRSGSRRDEGGGDGVRVGQRRHAKGRPARRRYGCPWCSRCMPCSVWLPPHRGDVSYCSTCSAAPATSTDATTASGPGAGSGRPPRRRPVAGRRRDG